MHRLRAAAVLVLLFAALAPVGSAGTAEDPELSDAAGDQVVDGPASGVPGFPPGIPGVSDEAFGDVDLVAAWWDQASANDCVGLPPGTCPTVDLLVATTAGWAGGTLTATFRLERGPTSYAHSNATGQTFTITVSGSGPAVTGLANATASVGPDGLRVKLPIPRLGAVGGDLLTGLNLTATRTDAGTLTDPAATQDDATGTDTAGPGAPYTMDRPERVSRWSIDIVSVGGSPRSDATFAERQDVPIAYRVTNLGTDRSPYVVNIRNDDHGLPEFHGLGEAGELDPFQSALHNVTVPMGGAEAGAHAIHFYLGDGTPLATATLTYEPLAAARGVVPAGLDFLTPAAESTGLDDAFGKYAELVLLALIVLLAILAVFLLVALAPSTLAGAAEPEAPNLKGPEGAPAGVLPAAAAVAPAPAPANPPASPAAATPGGALAIDSITHNPDAPEAGDEVATEVVLRNPGPTRPVRVVLAVDGRDADDKTVTLPARATKTVRLAWTAGPGENHVRVRVLPT